MKNDENVRNNSRTCDVKNLHYKMNLRKTTCGLAPKQTKNPRNDKLKIAKKS